MRSAAIVHPHWPRRALPVLPTHRGGAGVRSKAWPP